MEGSLPHSDRRRRGAGPPSALLPRTLRCGRHHRVLASRDRCRPRRRPPRQMPATPAASRVGEPSRTSSSICTSTSKQHQQQQQQQQREAPILRLPETARRWPRVVAPVPAPHISASRGRFRRAVEQQELGHSFVDKELEQNFGEEASPAARRDESGPMTLFGTATASRRGPTGGLGAAAPVRAASGARAPAYNLPTWQLRRRFYTHTHTHTHLGAHWHNHRKKKNQRA